MPGGLRLRSYLTRMIWLCIGPLVVLAAYLAYRDVRDIQLDGDANGRQMASTLATAIDRDLTARIGALQMLAESPSAAERSRWGDLYEEARGFGNSFGGYVIFADLNLQMRFNTRMPYGAPLPRLPIPRGRAAAPLAISTGRPAVGDLVQGPVVHEPLVAIAVPVKRGGQIESLLLCPFETRRLQAHLAQLALPQNWSVALLDSTGEAIAQRGGFKADQPVLGDLRIALATAPWHVVLRVPPDAYSEARRRAQTILLLAVLAATGLGLLGGTLAARRLNRAVASLASPGKMADEHRHIVEISAARRLLDASAMQREAANATLRESEHRFRSLFEQSPVPMFLVSQLGEIMDLNARFEQLFGYTRPDIPTVEQWHRLAYPDAIRREQIQADWRQTLVQAQNSGPAMEPAERQIQCKDGTLRDMLVYGLRVGDNFLAAFLDVTERKRESQSRQRLAAIVQSSDDAIISKSLQGLITSWNPGAQRLFGYSESEALGREILMLIPEDRQSEEAQILERIRRGQKVEHFETVRLRKDGSSIQISATVSPIHDESGQVVGASKIARDITERKLAQARLAAQLERLSLLDQITAAIAERLDLDSIYQVVLRRIEDRLPVDFGCILELVPASDSLKVLCVGASSSEGAWKLLLAPGQQISIAQSRLQACLQGQLIHEPNTAGRSLPFLQRFADQGLNSLVMAPLRAESKFHGLLLTARARAGSFSSADCEFLRQLSAHVALAAQQVALHAALQSAYDELRQTQQAVMQQERLRAFGQMASGVAHDINNAISPALLYTESLLEKESELGPRARSQLKTIARAIDGVAATVSRLREFYRPHDAEVTLCRLQLQPLVAQVLELTRARWHDMPLQRGVVIEVQNQLPTQLAAIMGIESELREALTNLVLNAVDAMPDGGTLRVSARQLSANAHPSVELSVSDSGVGMDEDTCRRCMEPFFTTKGERGTGLGLAMVYGTMQRHGADLRVDSAKGRGTTFYLTFPIPAGTAPTVSVAAVQRPLRRLHLLIVDDDPIVLTSMRETLEADWHTVVAADGGQAGIEAFEASLTTEQRFDAVITDLGMPYVDGRQVARAVKARSAPTPVILATGWGQRLVAENDIPPDVDGVLNKPPKLRELRALLAQLVRNS